MRPIRSASIWIKVCTRWTRPPSTCAFRCFPGPNSASTKPPSKCITLLHLHGNIPTFISITDGKVHDVNILDEILPEVGAIYVMARGYIDFERLYVFTLSSAFFVVRTKSNILLQRRYSHLVDKSTGVRSDHTVILTAFDSAKVYPDALRRVSYLDVATRKRFKFLTNNFALPALTIAQIYKSRWHQILQILSVTLFEKTPILRALQPSDSEEISLDFANQLNLFTL